ncbi:MAG: putative lipid II flippase FtsW [Gammaproteobacteria bacterium]|nr:putative lipid II flippase FtsW [Gammaproteobacteria bacterium]
MSRIDPLLVAVMVTIVAVGLVMVTSASVAIAERQSGGPTFYLLRQLAYCGAALVVVALVLRVPSTIWQRLGPLLLLFSLFLLLILFIPGLGRTVNGSTRWLMLGSINFQASELTKLAVVIYLAGYLVRRQREVRRHMKYFLRPMFLITFIGLIILVEPDFGAMVVILSTAMGMMFIGGVRLLHFLSLALLAMGGALLLAISNPYRMSRISGFLDPWQDPFNSGFQLTQALIAFGRGEWFGVGLGNSVQKLFYLPEAHTDFVYAVMAEELGMVGAVVLILLFVVLIQRIFRIGRQAEIRGELFSAYSCYGIAIWLAVQAFVNMGVNMGLLPTKGLTLPLVSYGGSSMVISCMALAIVLRI